MQKLLIVSFTILFSLGLSAQQSAYSGSDGKIKYDVKIEQLTDQQNDNFYEYYSLEIKNISNSKVSFTPVFNYTSETGESQSTISYDNLQTVTLSPGQTIKGNLNELNYLTLFKGYLIGNSGKKASNHTYVLNTISINY